MWGGLFVVRCQLLVNISVLKQRKSAKKNKVLSTMAIKLKRLWDRDVRILSFEFSWNWGVFLLFI